MGKGSGDLYIKSSAQSITSTAYTIEDCKYWNDGSSVGTLQIDSGVSVTSNGEYITIGSTSSEKYVYLPITLANSDNWEFSTTIARKDTNKVIGGIFNDASYYYTSDANDGRYRYSVSSGNVQHSKFAAVGDVITVRRENGVTKLFVNDVSGNAHTVNHKTSFKCGYYTFNSSQHIKDIKIRKL